MYKLNFFVKDCTTGYDGYKLNLDETQISLVFMVTNKLFIGNNH